MILHPNSHYFVPMMKFGDYGLAIACSDVERTHMVECKIKPYHDNSYDYNVYAIPVDPSDEAIYMNIAFYTKTFEELIKEGKIVEKTSDNNETTGNDDSDKKNELWQILVIIILGIVFVVSGSLAIMILVQIRNKRG